AAEEALRAVNILVVAPPLRAAALATLASAHLATGCATAARVAAAEAMAMLDITELEEGESLVRLVDALTLEATGHREEAGVALAAAKRRIVARAEKFSPAWRPKFLAIPENARTLALACDRGL